MRHADDVPNLIGSRSGRLHGSQPAQREHRRPPANPAKTSHKPSQASFPSACLPQPMPMWQGSIHLNAGPSRILAWFSFHTNPPLRSPEYPAEQKYMFLSCLYNNPTVSPGGKASSAHQRLYCLYVSDTNRRGLEDRQMGGCIPQHVRHIAISPVCRHLKAASSPLTDAMPPRTFMPDSMWAVVRGMAWKIGRVCM